MTDSDSRLVESTLAQPEVHQQWAGSYRTRDNEAFYEQAFDLIAAESAPPAGATFLDAGCGSCAHRPAPRPRFEIFVHSPRVEGVHLRGGSVARGGLRWSDRREDFRTEVLGLMKAQMVKNALIVPVGAKGGFVVKRRRRPRRCGEVGLLHDVHQRPAGHHRHDRRRRGRAAGATSCATTATTRTSSSPPTRAPRRSRTSPTASRRTTASGSATRSPPAARSATTTRRWGSPRAAPGCPSSATSASSASTSRPRTSPSPASAT